MRQLKAIFLVLVLQSILMNGSNVFARDKVVQKQINIGLRLESAGQIMAARALYESLYTRYPNDFRIFRRYKHVLLELQDYKNARILIRDQIKRKTQNVQVLLSEAEFYLHQFYSDSALGLIHKIIDMKPDDTSRYLLSGNLLIGSRLFDEAIEIYELGRNRMEQQDLFALQMANCYKLNAEYVKATKELLHYYRSNPKQDRYVEKEILRFPLTSSVLPEIIRTIEKASESFGKDLPLQKILIKLYSKSENYEKALKLTFEIESKTPAKNQGRQLHYFAIQAFQEDAVSVARDAYIKLLETYPEYQGIDEAWIGLGNVYKKVGDYEKALHAYTQSMRCRPKRAVQKKAILSKGLLQRDQLNQLDSASVTFSRLKNEFYRSREGQQAVQYLGQTRILQGYLDQAENIFQSIINKVPQKMALHLKGVVSLSRVYYFKGEFARALELLQKLGEMKDRNHDPVFNDGLSLQMFIRQYYQADSLALQKYALAELAVEMRETDQALVHLNSLAERTDSPLIEEALFLKGEILHQSGNVKKSVMIYQELIRLSPNSLLGEKAAYQVIQIFESRNKQKECLEACEQFIIQYPASLYIDDVRKKIRQLST